MSFARLEPGRTARVILLLLISGFAEALGLASLLPLLELAVGEPSEFSRQFLSFLELVNIPPTLGFLLGLIVAATVIKSLLTFLAKREAGYATAAVTARLRLTLFSGLMLSKWKYFNSLESGRISQVAINETMKGASVYNYLCNLVAALVQGLVYLATAVAVSWEIAVSAIICGLILMKALSGLIKFARQMGERQTELFQSLSSRLVDALGMIKPLKSMHQEKAVRPLLEKESEELETVQKKLVLLDAGLEASYEPAIAFFIAIGAFVALSYTSMTVPELIFVAFLFQRGVSRLGFMQSTYQRIIARIASLQSVQSIITETGKMKEKIHGGTAPSFDQDVRIENLTFSHGANPLFEGLNLTLKSNSVMALVGPSGSGKTTILDLLIGLHDPQAGRVLVDDVPLSELDLAKWRNMIGYVPQDCYLFHGSLLDNLLMGESDLSREDALEALDMAGADFISRLENGVDTMVGERGTSLSGGQRQRVALARALIRNPKLLILDEATSALDESTEQSVVSSLEKLKGKITMVITSHRPAIIEMADQVVDLS